jgi:hypothetical protein
MPAACANRKYSLFHSSITQGISTATQYLFYAVPITCKQKNSMWSDETGATFVKKAQKKLCYLNAIC